jgi:hypothetical protein
MFLTVVSISARVGRKCLKSQVRVVRIVNWYWLVFKLLNKSFFYNLLHTKPLFIEWTARLKVGSPVPGRFCYLV